MSDAADGSRAHRGDAVRFMRRWLADASALDRLVDMTERVRESALDRQRADELARRWVEAWNRHDLEAILSRCAGDVSFTSPLIASLTGSAASTLEGRDELRAFVESYLAAYPDACFELLQVFSGVESLVIHYRGAGGVPLVEVQALDGEGLVCQSVAHYGWRLLSPAETAIGPA